MNEEHGIIIREAYKDYQPPFDVTATVHRLLNGLPQKRLAALKPQPHRHNTIIMIPSRLGPSVLVDISTSFFYVFPKGVADNSDRAPLPENPPSIMLSGQMFLIING
jgi:hypothetical protein